MKIMIHKRQTKL